MIRGRHPSRYGFTLLELSIVLAIISLIAGVGMKMASDALKAADRISTQERLNTIKTALDSFSKTYGYLPCPADRNITPASTSFGVELRGAAQCNSNAPSVNSIGGNAYSGMVPVRTLGLPDTYAGDAWGNKIDYTVTNGSSAKFTATQLQMGALTILYGDRTTYYIQSTYRQWEKFLSVANNGSGLARVTVSGSDPAPPPTGTIVYMNGGVYKGSYSITKISATTFDLQGSTYSATDSGTFEYQNLNNGALGSYNGATYAVVSHGKDGRGAYPLNGTAIPGNKVCNNSATGNSSPAPCTDSSMTSCIDIENCNEDLNFFDTAYNDGTQASLYFDDYIVWGSNERSPALYYSSCPAGTCENWCASCTVNYPGGGATAPPSGVFLSGFTGYPFLYKKVLTSNSTTCAATCFWGGLTVAPTKYIKGP